MKRDQRMDVVVTDKIVTDQKTAQKVPAVVILNPNKRGNFNKVEIDTNLIKSAYGKKNPIRYISKALLDDLLLDVNVEKSQHIRNTPGVKFPNNIP